MVSSTEGISNYRLHRVLRIIRKSASFMSHRIHEALRTDGTMDFGSDGDMLEADETGACPDPAHGKA